MASLRADRRLYETPEKDAIVEEGDVRGRWLIAGIGSTIGASDVEKYGLSMKGGRVRYEGAPGFADLPKVKEASKPEDKAATEHEDKRLTFGGVEDGDAASTDTVTLEAAEDFDQNKPAPEWLGRTSPEKYLERYPTGPRAKFAAEVIAAKDDGAGGDS